MTESGNGSPFAANFADKTERYKPQTERRALMPGWTTGTCAAAAAGAAASMLLTQKNCTAYRITLPSGKKLVLEILAAFFNKDYAECAVRKFGGDDPDVTSGVLVYARVGRADTEGVKIEGGLGIGRVTRAGLDQKIGEAAINSVPRKMIEKECNTVREKAGEAGGLSVTISIPEGVELAARTFNPKLGITGGISVLGTSGEVEPMSERAFEESIKLEIKQLFAEGTRDLVLVVGNFAGAFCRDALGLEFAPSVKCSNFIGAALEYAASLKMRRLLIVGHFGKLVKLALGIVNTHSAHGDGRLEAIVYSALCAGAPYQVLQKLQGCVTTDAAIAVLKPSGFLERTMDIIRTKIEEVILRRGAGLDGAGFISFSKRESFGEGGANMVRDGEIVVQSANAEDILRALRDEYRGGDSAGSDCECYE